MMSGFTFILGFIAAWLIRGALFRRAIGEAFAPLATTESHIRIGEVYRTESADPFRLKPIRWLITNVSGDYIQYVDAEHPESTIRWSGRAKNFLLVNKRESA